MAEFDKITRSITDIGRVVHELKRVDLTLLERASALDTIERHLLDLQRFVKEADDHDTRERKRLER